jgi:uncharacterized protein YbcI
MATPNVSELPVGVSPTAAISNHVVHVISEYTGRGPTKARTCINDRLVTCLLEDTLTKGERTLVRDGQHERVLDTRHAYQHTMRERLVAGIEEILGQKVVAFMSDNHIDPDMAIEAFVLAPAANNDGAH